MQPQDYRNQRLQSVVSACRRLCEKQKHSTTKIIKKPMFVMKRNMNMKELENKYDCFILDFNPYHHQQKSYLSNYSYKNKYGDDDVRITAVNGKVALRDYAHPRHLCARYPFNTTTHSNFCQRCYCYVCDVAAPCKHWLSHCNASDLSSHWKSLRWEKHKSKQRALRA